MKKTNVLPLLLLLGGAALPGSAMLHAGQQTQISGTLLGADGKPLAKGTVHLLRPGARTPFLSADAGANGAFSISTAATGLLTLQFTGAGHSMYEVPVVVETPRTIHLDVKLGAHHFTQSFDSVKVVGDFNDFDAATAMPMTKGRDGIYRATFKTGEKKFAYQLAMMMSVGKSERRRFVNGTDFAELTYDGGGDYRSVVIPRNGEATITFDPAKLPTGSEKEIVKFGDPATERLANIAAGIDERTAMLNDAIRAKLRAGEDVGEFTYDWSATATDIAKRINAATDPAIRAELMIDYLTLGTQAASGLDSTIARRALAEIPATSPLWGIEPETLGSTLALANDNAKYETYRWTAIEKQADTNVRLQLLNSGVEQAAAAKNVTEVRRILGYMSKTFPTRNEVKYAMATYDPDRAIRIGQPVPHFEVASLENPSVKLSESAMKGKYYLIDFWATWCGPCIGEMGNLHKAYEKFHGRNFEIVSLSFDGKPGDIAGFRNKKWNMPWLHGFVEGNFNSDLAKRFEVLGIPKPILVDVSGTIVAAGDELRGAGLDKTLERVLGTAN